MPYDAEKLLLAVGAWKNWRMSYIMVVLVLATLFWVGRI